MGRAQILESDAVFSIASWRNLIVVTWREAPEVSRVARVRQELARRCLEQPTGLLVVIRATHPMPAADARAEAMAMIRSRASQPRFVCVLYEASGVAATLLFATVRTMFMLGDGPKLKLAHGVEEAAAFVAPQVIPGTTRDEIARLVADLE
ncbi:MAG: hypothetical protein R3B13_19735 [Polyangiaceae bacterium]